MKVKRVAEGYFKVMGCPGQEVGILVVLAALMLFAGWWFKI